MNKAAKYGLVIILLVFFSIFGFVGGASYLEDLHNKKIAETATQTTTAEVIEAWSNLSVNGVDYYYIIFEYMDEKGQIRRGETNSAYTYREAKNIVQEIGELEIKYNSNHEAVAADFRVSADFGIMAVMFYIGVAGVAAALIAGVFVTIQVKKESGVKKNGKQAVATFVDKTCNTYVNGSPRYRIVYKFVASEEGGETRTIKSRELFTLEDAIYYETNKQFDVKYSGKIAVITEKPYSKPARTQVSKPQVNTSVASEDGACDEHKNCDFGANASTSTTPLTTYADFGDPYIERETALDKNILCEHCAAHLSPKDKHCPNCGAKVRKS